MDILWIALVALLAAATRGLIEICDRERRGS